jgi:arylsulfatase
MSYRLLPSRGCTNFAVGLIFALSVLLPAAFAEEVLPKPPAPFSGQIDPSREKAVPAWPALPKAKPGAPNVVVVLLDDVGFGAASTFGGVARTPTLQALADHGIAYNQFHVSSLCSPTRATLLTGRNHHAAGFGTVANNSSGFPGYNSIWDKDTVSVAEVLRQNGYSTAAFGKWHNTPEWEITPAGPYEHWPTRLGFEHFYGFMGGADNQWEPRLWRDTTPVEPKARPEQGYHLAADLADDAIRWLRTHDAVHPDKPFFIWYGAPGTHWPHHVPAEWIGQYKGKFDQGWDKLREEIFARQKALGVIPATAELTPRPPELPAWDSLPTDQRKLLAHQAEVAAAYLAYTDYQIGRVLAAIREQGQADDTAVFYIVGDNGAEASSPLLGRDAWQADAKPHSVEERVKRLAELGGPAFDNQYGSAWGWADNTPFKYAKGIPAYLGGTRNPLVVSWPKGIRARGEVRGHFSHATDLAPTVYELAGVSFPDQVEGIKQAPLEGKSLAYSFDQPAAATPRTVQYFEIGGSRGIYKDGWWAGSRNVTPSATSALAVGPAGQRDWELYNLKDDFTQAHDLAAQHPDKVAELTNLFHRLHLPSRRAAHPLPGWAGRHPARSHDQGGTGQLRPSRRGGHHRRRRPLRRPQPLREGRAADLRGYLPAQPHRPDRRHPATAQRTGAGGVRVHAISEPQDGRTAAAGPHSGARAR